jgi:hypothetical protein
MATPCAASAPCSILTAGLLEHGGKDASRDDGDAIAEVGIGRGGSTNRSGSGGILLLIIRLIVVRTGLIAALVLGRLAVGLGIGGIKRAAVGLDVGLARTLAPRVARVLADALLEGFLADFLSSRLASAQLIGVGFARGLSSQWAWSGCSTADRGQCRCCTGRCTPGFPNARWSVHDSSRNNRRYCTYIDALVGRHGVEAERVARVVLGVAPIG